MALGPPGSDPVTSKSGAWFVVTKSLREVLLIFAGVAAALVANSYAESIRERRLEADYLQRLTVDIENNQQELASLISLWRLYEQSAARVMAFLESSDSTPQLDSLLVATVLASMITVPTLENPTYDELIGSSRLSILRDVGVRETLLRYQRRLQFGDAFIARLDRRYDEVINLRVPASLIRSITRFCRPEPYGSRGTCPPELGGFDVAGFVRELDSMPDLPGKLNWRLSEAIRVREILEMRLAEAQTAHDVISPAAARRRGAWP